MIADREGARCRNCMFWHAGHPPLAAATRHITPTPSVGTCEFRAPTVHIVAGIILSLYPEVHADRHCWDHLPIDFINDPDGGEEVHTAEVVELDERRAA